MRVFPIIYSPTDVIGLSNIFGRANYSQSAYSTHLTTGNRFAGDRNVVIPRIKQINSRRFRKGIYVLFVMRIEKPIALDNFPRISILAEASFNQEFSRLRFIFFCRTVGIIPLLGVVSVISVPLAQRYQSALNPIRSRLARIHDFTISYVVYRWRGNTRFLGNAKRRNGKIIQAILYLLRDILQRTVKDFFQQRQITFTRLGLVILPIRYLRPMLPDFGCELGLAPAFPAPRIINPTADCRILQRTVKNFFQQRQIMFIRRSFVILPIGYLRRELPDSGCELDLAPALPLPRTENHIADSSHGSNPLGADYQRPHQVRPWRSCSAARGHEESTFNLLSRRCKLNFGGAFAFPDSGRHRIGACAAAVGGALSADARRRGAALLLWWMGPTIPDAGREGA